MYQWSNPPRSESRQSSKKCLKPLPAPETHVRLTQTAPGNVPAPFARQKTLRSPEPLFPRMGVQQNPTFPFQQCDLLPDVSPRNALPPEGNQKLNFIPTDTVILHIYACTRDELCPRGRGVPLGLSVLCLSPPLTAPHRLPVMSIVFNTCPQKQKSV